MTSTTVETRTAYGRSELTSIDALDRSGFETVEFNIESASALAGRSLTLFLRSDGTKLSTFGQHSFSFLSEDDRYASEFLHSMEVQQPHELDGRKILGYFNKSTGLVEALYPVAR